MASECVDRIWRAICSCLLGLDFHQEQRPTTLHIQTSSVNTNTQVIPSSTSSVTPTTEVIPPPPPPPSSSSVITTIEVIPPPRPPPPSSSSSSSVITTIEVILPPRPPRPPRPPPSSSSPLATSSTSSSSSSSTLLSLSSSAPSGKLTYDVFLSFRGIDNRNKFTDHLYTALVQKGIHTFRDDEELESGDSIGPTLLKAIEESRYVIVILSQGYADSAWCLEELAKVVECKMSEKTVRQFVIPVFYDVHPFEVRRQKVNRFNAAFEKHQKRNPDKLQRWKDALFQVSNISGWHLQNRSEAKVIQGIVKFVSMELNKIISKSEGLVGMDTHLDKMLSYLDIPRHDDVRIIGICGMGGVGKSTIAQVLFNRIKVQFEGASFLPNVREEMEKQGTVQLQKQLLSDLLTRNVDVDNIEMGKNTMRERLKTKRVLIILDDVDSAEQLEVLCDRRWYGPGSRIIITTRNVHLHIVVEGDKVYNVDPLSDSEALQLFKMEAFKKDELVGDEYLKLSEEFVKYTGGLPLAIKVLGASVKGRNADLWLSTLVRLKKNPDEKIMNVLKVSFDGLTKTEKSNFLDIACFLKGKSLDRVRRILQGSDAFCPDLDLEVLQEKYMVVLFGKKLWMHDLIQEMGREVIREEHSEEPEKRSRLWIPDEILDVFDENKATGAIQSILLQGPTVDDVDPNDTFSKMTKLRLLKISNVKFSGDIKYLSKKLQFLYWDEWPSNSFPKKFQPDYLVELHMRSSCIKQLWTGERGWGMLRLIDMSGSQYLMSTPDFTKVPNLEKLVLQDCTSLVKIHPSLGALKKLVCLDMRNCKSIESIPAFTALESLQILILSLCSGLKKFPEIVGNMESLLELHLDGTSFEELPPSIFERLSGLTMLNLTDCKNLLHLPDTIGCLKCLEKLFIGGTSIREFSSIVGMKNLQYLLCRGCERLVPEACKGLASLSSLTKLDLSYCHLDDGAFLDDLSCLNSLKELDLSGNCFVRLPESLSEFSKIDTLKLNNCRQLEFLPKKLPLSLRLVRYVYANNCTSLTDYPNQIKVLTSPGRVMTIINSLDSTGSSALSKISSTVTSRRSKDGFVQLHLEHKYTDGKLIYHHKPLTDHVRLSQFSAPTVILAIDEISEWFGDNISTRNHISIPIPQNETELTGIFTCAVFSVKGHTDHTIIEPDSNFSNSSYQMTLETDVISSVSRVAKAHNSECRGCSSHVLVIFYVDGSEVTGRGSGKEASVVKAIFETTNPSMVVQRCAIRPVYGPADGILYSRIMPGHMWGTFQSLDNVEEADSVVESGWFGESCGEWAKFVPPFEQESAIMLRRNLESVLPRCLEARKTCSMYKFNVRGRPGWFRKSPNTTRSRMHRLSMELPENLHKSKKWMGFVIFATLVEEVGQTTEKENYEVFVELQIPGDESRGLVVRTELHHFRPLSDEHHQLLVQFIPRAQIPDVLFTQTSTTALIDFYIWISSSPHVKVQRFGYRIAYQKDIQGFADTIFQCIQREGSLEKYNKLVVKEWMQLIRCEGAPIQRMTERDTRTPRQKYFDLHSQKYRNWEWSTDRRNLHCSFERVDMSKWKRFMPLINQGNSAEIQLPVNVLDDDNWLGFAVCCWLSHDHQYPNISLGADIESDNVMLRGRLHSDVAWYGLYDCMIRAPLRLPNCNLTSFWYIPRKKLYKLWRQCGLARVTMWLTENPPLAVTSCALRLVYKEDVEHLVQTLTLAELP